MGIDSNTPPHQGRHHMNTPAKCDCKDYRDGTQPHDRTCPNHNH